MSKKTKAPLLGGQSSMLSYITVTGKENRNPNVAPALAGDVINIDVDSDLDDDAPPFACKKAKVEVDDSQVGSEEHVSVGNNFLGLDGSRDPDAERIAKFEGILDLVPMQYGFSMDIPEFSKVIEYAKECLKEIRPGKTNIILQLKCPVAKKNASGESISLALGGNCPDEKRWSICTVRCADQLFGGKDNLRKFFIFNLRVECRIDEKTGRCAVCSPREAEALGTVYEILCQYAFEIGAKMNYISMAGTTSGIESTLGNHYLKNKRHPDGTPYFVNYLPNGYHLSLLSYHCDLVGTVEVQVRKITEMVKNISDALGDPALFTNALANQYLPFVVNWDTMSNEDKDEMKKFWHTLQGRTKLGNYAYMFKIGIFAAEYVELRAIWSKKGGERCYELGHGIFDPNHPMLKAAGCTNWGQWCVIEGKGIFDPNHPLLKASGCNNFGEYIFLMKLGIYDPANAQAVHDGSVKGGNIVGNKHRDEMTGLIGAKIKGWWSRLPELRKYMRKENSFGYVPKSHSLHKYVWGIRRCYRNQLKDGNAVTDEDIQRIILGDEKLKVLADMGFCFVPPNAMSKKACGCRHCTTKHFR